MSRRSEKESDSLWLLLDTISNAFGGFLLITMMAAIFANEVRVSKPTRELEEALTNAVNQVKQAEQERGKLQKEMGSMLPKTNFWGKILLLSNDCNKLALAVSNLDDAFHTNHWIVTHPEAATSNTRTQLDILTQQLTRNTNSLTTLMATFDDLTNTLRMVQSVSLTNELRFPKEHDASKIPLHVILRYNRVYFSRDPSRPDDRVNTEGLRWAMGQTNKILVAAIPGRGIFPDDAALEKKLKAIDAPRTYLVCWVYADSFPAFSLIEDTIQRFNQERAENGCPDQIGAPPQPKADPARPAQDRQTPPQRESEQAPQQQQYPPTGQNRPRDHRCDLEYGWTPVELDQTITVAAEKIPPTPAQ